MYVSASLVKHFTSFFVPGASTQSLLLFVTNDTYVHWEQYLGLSVSEILLLFDAEGLSVSFFSSCCAYS